MHDATETRLLTDNRLLSAVPAPELDFLRPHLRSAFFKTGTLLAESGDPIRQCIFPNKGMISLLAVTEAGNTVEVGYTGREGMLGMASVLGKNEMPYQALVQAGADCLVADSAAVYTLFRQGGVFHDLLLRYLYALLRQFSQTCVCNHFHTIEARLCRWLAVMCERSGNRHLTLTQEFLAHMLGVQRTSIGLIATSLQASGVISYRRGRIEIVDYERLTASACECFHIVNKEYEDLFD